MKELELESRNTDLSIISVESFYCHSAFLWIDFLKNRNACLEMFIVWSYLTNWNILNSGFNNFVLHLPFDWEEKQWRYWSLNLYNAFYSLMYFKIIIPLKPYTWEAEWKVEKKPALYLNHPRYLAGNIMKMRIFQLWSTELWDLWTPFSSSQRGTDEGIEGERVVVCTFLNSTRATRLWFVWYTGASLALFWRKSSRTK